MLAPLAILAALAVVALPIYVVPDDWTVPAMIVAILFGFVSACRSRSPWPGACASRC